MYLISWEEKGQTKVKRIQCPFAAQEKVRQLLDKNITSEVVLIP